MFETLLRDIRQFSRRLQVRILLIAALSPLAVVFAKIIGPLIPFDLTQWIGADAVDPILQIIAGSMLAVTIFALTMMTGAFRAVSGLWTPRAHLVMMEDTVTQNVLSTFLGSWLFALTAIILRSSEVFGENEKVVLFFFTVVVVLLVVLAMIRWILHLETLGSLIETCRRLEDKADIALSDRTRQPALGANLLIDPARQIPAQTARALAASSGHVQRIGLARLQEIAEAQDVQIYVRAPVGQFVFEGDPLAEVYPPNETDEDCLAAITAGFHIGTLRNFDDDPRFGIIALSEVAVRALSSGVNDPGTAVDVLHRLGRILRDWRRVDVDDETLDHDRVWMAPLDPDEVLADAFDAIARCAGDTLEVHLTLQKVLAGLQRHGDALLAAAADRAGLRGLQRAEIGLRLATDYQRVEAIQRGGA